MSQTLQMLYAGEDASPVTPVLPLERFAREKCCTLVLLRKIILKTRAVYMFLKKSIFFYLVLGVIHVETYYKCDCLVSSS